MGLLVLNLLDGNIGVCIGYWGGCFDVCLGWVGLDVDGWLFSGVDGMGKRSHGVRDGSIVSMIVLVTLTWTGSKAHPLKRGLGSYTKTIRSILPRKAGLSAQPVIDPVLCNAAIMKQMALSPR